MASNYALERYDRFYQHWAKTLQTTTNRHKAMADVIGGDFEWIGPLLRDVLLYHGLAPDHYVIDVGCGSGRLAVPMAQYLQGPYLGTDLSPDLVQYARDLVQRPDWRFEVTDGIRIPEQDGMADIVCFFSVLTHLLHEHSFRYLREARRVLKPGGKIVLTFLEFRQPLHWAQFQATVDDESGEFPLITFIEREAIVAWAEHLGLTVEAIHDGNQRFPSRARGLLVEQYPLGQSTCVLSTSSE